MLVSFTSFTNFYCFFRQMLFNVDISIMLAWLVNFLIPKFAKPNSVLAYISMMIACLANLEIPTIIKSNSILYFDISIMLA